MWTNSKKTQTCSVQFSFPKSGHLIANPSPPTSNLHYKEHTNDHISVMGQHFKPSSYFKRVLHCLWGASMPFPTPPLSTRELSWGIAECRCPVTGNTSSGAESNGPRMPWVRKVSDGPLRSRWASHCLLSCCCCSVSLCLFAPSFSSETWDGLNVKLQVRARQSRRVSHRFLMKEGFYPALLETWPTFCQKFRACQRGWI